MDLKKEFENKYGLDLEEILPNAHFEQDKVHRFIARQIELLETFCQSRNSTFSYKDLSEQKKNIFDEIALEQMYWTLNTDDYSVVSGIDLTTGMSIPIIELTSRYISPTVQIKLKANGFCFRGLGC
jgi:hypothetical protein